MPLRIWMPSCAAGPLKTAAWPTRMLLAVTPVCAPASGASPSARVKVNRVRVIGSSPPSVSDHQEALVAHQRRDVELLPCRARLVDVLRPQPRRRAGRGLLALARLHLGRVAQAERAADEQRGRHAEAVRDEKQ